MNEALVKILVSLIVRMRTNRGSTVYLHWPWISGVWRNLLYFIEGRNPYPFAISLKKWVNSCMQSVSKETFVALCLHIKLCQSVTMQCQTIFCWDFVLILLYYMQIQGVYPIPIIRVYWKQKLLAHQMFCSISRPILLWNKPRSGIIKAFKQKQNRSFWYWDESLACWL